MIAGPIDSGFNAFEILFDATLFDQNGGDTLILFDKVKINLLRKKT